LAEKLYFLTIAQPGTFFKKLLTNLVHFQTFLLIILRTHRVKKNTRIPKYLKNYKFYRKLFQVKVVRFKKIYDRISIVLYLSDVAKIRTKILEF